MKVIKFSEYNPQKGILINLENDDSYNYLSSLNVTLDKLILDRKELLDINKKYYLICEKGFHSKKVTQLLEFYGYDVTQVVKN